MNYHQTNQLTNSQKRQIMGIWNKVYPAQIIHETLASFEQYLLPLQNDTHILVLDDQKNILGWLVTFDREGDRWFAMLLDDTIKGKGIGSELLRQAKLRNYALNGWVTDHNRYHRKDGVSYLSPLGFYIKNDFIILEDIRFEDEKLSLVKVRWERI